MKDYAENVRFSAKISPSRYCCCDGCHRCTRVIQITLPTTLYHNHRTLSTRYYQRWFCRDCADKLLAALAAACAAIHEAEKEDE